MSMEIDPDDGTMCCASCGKAKVDNIKLMRCTACYLVRYCSVVCQKSHQSQHKRACKKRAAELRDEILFKQPESSHLGDCPICCLPVPLDRKKSVSFSCCSKSICLGCMYANAALECSEKRIPKCPFCRHLCGQSKEKIERRRKERFEANDPFALREAGRTHFYDGDHKRAFEYWTKAAKLGDAKSHYQLSELYTDGLGVERNKKKVIYH